MSENAVAPTVSVIIPSYNAARYIEHAISSALASRNVNLEVIVIDDGSTDGTWQIIESYGERLTRVRQRHAGPYRARNCGAQIARGEWLAFLDADDDWLPDKLASQLAAADDAVGLLYTDRLNFGDTSRFKERQSDSVKLWDGDVFEHLLLDNFITLSSVLIRKACFDDLGGFAVERRGVQDWDMWLRYAGMGGKVRLCREPLTRYRIHSEQMSNDWMKRAADREAVLRNALASPRGQLVSRRVVRQAFASLSELAASSALAAGEAQAAAVYYVRSAMYWPWSSRPYKGMVKCSLRRTGC